MSKVSHAGIARYNLENLDRHHKPAEVSNVNLAYVQAHATLALVDAVNQLRETINDQTRDKEDNE